MKKMAKKKRSGKRSRRGVQVQKATVMGLGGRVFYCTPGGAKKGSKCYPKQYITNLQLKTRKKRDGTTKRVWVADISTAGSLFRTPGGKGTEFRPKVRKNPKMKAAARSCVKKGKKPGTKAWGQCIKAYFRK